MQEKSDAELLREYVARANEAAFREIITRHADLVYASALRQVSSPELARDIAQTVFADLVRKAPALGQTVAENASLVGWLYRSTRFEAHTQLRDDRRRQARERQAMENFDPNSETDTEWERVGPVLDEAMADLSDEDRDALLLRFFKHHDFRAIGVALGVSDDAAQKRVSRALERLRAEFTRRGVTTTAGGLSALLVANTVSLAPAGLAATLSTAALTGTTLTTAAATTKVIAMTTLQKTVIGVALSAAVGVGIYEARQASTLRSQAQTLQQQQVEQAQQLQRERVDITRQLAAMRDDNERLNRNTAELLRLRGEVARLKADSQELSALKASTSEKTNDSLVKAMGDWVSRATALQRRIEEMPDIRIPEFQFIRDEDWLNAVRYTKVDTDQGMATAVLQIKIDAKQTFALQMSAALRKFIEANTGELPTQLAQLKPFFTVPVGDEVLERYEMLHSGNVKDISERNRKFALISERKVSADSTTQAMIQIGDTSFQNLNSY